MNNLEMVDDEVLCNQVSALERQVRYIARNLRSDECHRRIESVFNLNIPLEYKKIKLQKLLHQLQQMRKSTNHRRNNGPRRFNRNNTQVIYHHHNYYTKNLAPPGVLQSDYEQLIRYISRPRNFYTIYDYMISKMEKPGVRGSDRHSTTSSQHENAREESTRERRSSQSSWNNSEEIEILDHKAESVKHEIVTID